MYFFLVLSIDSNKFDSDKLALITIQYKYTAYNQF